MGKSVQGGATGQVLSAVAAADAPGPAAAGGTSARPGHRQSRQQRCRACGHLAGRSDPGQHRAKATGQGTGHDGES
jgi:hypothetical protein